MSFPREAAKEPVRGIEIHPVCAGPLEEVVDPPRRVVPRVGVGRDPVDVGRDPAGDTHSPKGASEFVDVGLSRIPLDEGTFDGLGFDEDEDAPVT